LLELKGIISHREQHQVKKLLTVCTWPTI